MLDSGFRKDRVQACYFANALAPMLFGDSSVGQNVTAAAGLDAIPVVNVENACTSGSTAFYLARNAILAGECDVALVLGAEKMCVPGFGLIDSGASELDTQLGLVTPASFALRACRHMHEFGTSPQQLAEVTVKSRRHAALNSLAQLRQPETLAQVMASPMIADPLTRSQCCPPADGAAALLLVSSDVARTCKRSVRVAASVLTSGQFQATQDLAYWGTDYRSAELAYDRAGIGPTDLDVVECHDAFTISEILHYEALGLCAPGEGGAYVEQGQASLGGRVPVNVSGGLLSRGHPIAATGVAQIAELVTQLRGEAGPRQVENCRVALAHCMGGDKDSDTKSCTINVLCSA